jgi:hypothetical protein
MLSSLKLMGKQSGRDDRNSKRLCSPQSLSGWGLKKIGFAEDSAVNKWEAIYFISYNSNKKKYYKNCIIIFLFL